MTNSLLTTVRDLGRRRGRERRGLALAEGVRLVEEALAAGIEVRGAAVSPTLEATSRGKSLVEALRAAGVRLEAVSDDALAGLADTEQPQGIVAIIAPPRWALDHIDLGHRRPAVVLDGVQDPGNVGTMVRTALGLGAAGVVALKGTAELANPKVIRSTMGALFRLPCVASDADGFLAWARERGAEVWVAAMDGEPVARVLAGGPATRPVALVIGNEGAGVGPTLAEAADRRVSIPLAGPAESLNAAVAAAILLYEVTRER
jgi:TrmH family RNA methyltransferase